MTGQNEAKCLWVHQVRKQFFKKYIDKSNNSQQKQTNKKPGGCVHVKRIQVIIYPEIKSHLGRSPNGQSWLNMGNKIMRALDYNP